MAKAKKTTSSDTDKAPAKKTSRAATSKTRKPAKSGTSAATSSPLIDTNLAAANAARMLAAKAKLQGAVQEEVGAAKETAAFKELKENLAKPAASALSTALGNTFGPAKPTTSTHGFDRQVAHNQTQGGARFNVPRRTSGG